ncbi:hypothetical protein TWF281_006747, partial [Arthrobotrys megalospora]
MLSSGMRESWTRTVRLDHETDTPLAFEKFVQWCYFGYYVYDGQNYSTPLSIDASAYIFADRIQCLALKDFALKQAILTCAGKGKIQTKRNLSKLPATVLFIYKNTLDTASGKSDPNVEAQCVDKPDVVEARGTSVNSGKSSGAPSPPQEGFRELLAAFSALNLEHLRKESSFMDVCRSSSDFAADVLFFVQQGSFDIKTL